MLGEHPAIVPLGQEKEWEGKMLNTFRIGADPVEYHCDKSAISQGGLVVMEQSPAHFMRAWREPYRPGGSDVQVTGTLVHLAILEPYRWQGYSVMPAFGDRRFKENKAAHADWLMSLPEGWVTTNEKGERTGVSSSALLVSAEEKARVEAMAENVLRHPDLSALLKDALTEATVYWIDPGTRILNRARLDIVSGAGIIGDLKTCEDARELAFAKSIHNNDYDFQAGHYVEAGNSTGGGYSDFVFGAVERNPPYGVWGHVLSQRALERGKARRAAALAKLRDCIVSNEWPGYPNRLTPIDLPPYAYQGGTF